MVVAFDACVLTCIRGLGVKCWLLSGVLVFGREVKYGFLEVLLHISKLVRSFGAFGLIFRAFEPKFVGFLE